MTLALALVLLGTLLIYAGVRGQSVRELLLGRSGMTRTLPTAVK